MRSAQHADENLRALREAGIRGRFSYGTSQGAPPTDMMNIADVARLKTGWDKFSNEGLLSLGLAWRGGTSDVARKELHAARGMGIQISAHAIGGGGEMLKAKLLGSDMQLIHAIDVRPADIKGIADAGCSVSLSPFTELRTGFGFPKTSEFLDAGVRVGLSVDTTGLSGNADMFSIMKLIQNLENARALSEFKMSARRVLELATIEGARSMGIDEVTGSIRAGKRADLIVVNTRALNLAVMGDPVGMIVEAAAPANVETVVVDGRILKRDGRLTAVDQDVVVREAAAAFEDVRKRAGW
jgi:cytosine/adenosine deaminase-related metal-dependent hydrolase